MAALWISAADVFGDPLAAGVALGVWAADSRGVHVSMGVANTETDPEARGERNVWTEPGVRPRPADGPPGVQSWATADRTASGTSQLELSTGSS